MTLTEDIEELNKIIHPTETVIEKDVLSTYRDAELVYQRAILCYYLRRKGYSLKHIALLLDKNHATIINSLKYSASSRCKNIFNIVKAKIDRVCDKKEFPKICPYCKQPMPHK